MEGGVGTFVRERRTARSLSLSALADRSGVSKAALSTWERGLRQPSLPELDAVLRILGVDAEERAQALRMIDAPRARRELRRVSEDVPAPVVSGDLLRALRIRRGLSLSETARALSVQSSTVLRWEAGDGWPSAERLALLCRTLGARPRECDALFAGALSPVGARQPGDLEAIERSLHRVAQRMWVLETATFVELDLLAALADLWPLVGHSQTAARLYQQAAGMMARWLLLASGSLDAAVPYARAALSVGGNDIPERDILWPLHILGKAAAYGGGRKRPRAGARFLQEWLPKFGPDSAATVWFTRDVAEFLSDAGDTDQALLLSDQARVAARRAGHSQHHADFDHGCILLNSGRAQEALAVLPPFEATMPLQDVREALAWAEALLAVGERRETERWVRHAGAIIDEHSLTAFRPRLARLAACLG